jgi:hypothetical protein
VSTRLAPLVVLIQVEADIALRARIQQHQAASLAEDTGQLSTGSDSDKASVPPGQETHHTRGPGEQQGNY